MTKRARARGTAARSASVVSVVTLDGTDERTVLGWAASVAAELDEPIAEAIAASARDAGAMVPAEVRVDAASGAGVIAAVDGRRVVLGDSPHLKRLGIAVHGAGGWCERLTRQGQRVLLVAVDGRPCGCIGIEETEEKMKTIHAARPAEPFPTDPQDLPAATRPESLDLTAGGRVHLHVAPVSKRIGANTLRMLAYNGSIPGPILRVRQGSELLVDVTNDGDMETTVHWHGLRLDNRFDGTLATQDPIPVGGSFTYRLSFPDAGIYWYHPHVREDYGQEMGLYGNIVVVPADAGYWPAADRELVLALDDLLVEDGALVPFDRSGPNFAAMGRFGNVMLVNGETEPTLTARRGEVVRLYLTNTANTRVFDVALPGAKLKLVGGDSGRYERETFVEQVVIAPSERVVIDALFELAGELTLEHRTPSRTYRLATMAVADGAIETSIAAAFSEPRTDTELRAEREEIEAWLETPPAKTLAFVAEMDMGAAAHGGSVTFVCPMHPEVTSPHAGRCPRCGMKLLPADVVTAAGHDAHHGHGGHDGGHPGHGLAPAASAPAGIEWEDDMFEVNRRTNPANTRWKLVDRATGAFGPAIDWEFRRGDRIKIRLVNEMDSDHPMHHPFHVHGAGRFLILARDGRPESNLVWKDTVLVPTGQTTDILLDVTETGTWMAHCHIAEHHESGMMLSFRVRP